MCCGISIIILGYGPEIPVGNELRGQRREDLHISSRNDPCEQAADDRSFSHSSQGTETCDAYQRGYDDHRGIGDDAHLSIVLLHTHRERIREPISWNHDDIRHDLEIDSHSKDENAYEN